MLEHTAMYFTPICEEDTSSFPDFYTRLGPCELQDPVWAKMSALASGAKKRKKSETKPQAQINKCNNEKRRREQENIYIEELAELISANFADMSSLSVKPDKCAILQETVNQIRSIKQRESASRSTDPVQQGEVSSSRPNILSTDVYGHLLLEALDGFLFVVNGEGKVEHVTKNVQKFIKFTDKEILGETIYNFIHPGDHASFVSSLPMSIGWSSETSTKSRSFSCRLLIKSDDQDDSSKDKSSQLSQQQQQQRDRYELMSISSTQLTQDSTGSEDDPSDGGPCLLCVASRITHRDRAAIFTIEQFTTKLDTSGKIIGIDTSGVSAYTQFLNKDLMGRILQDLCAKQDNRKLTQHLRDTLSAGQGTSVTYRLKLSQDNYVNVQTKSKLFKAGPLSSEADFIMATHAIIGDNEQTRPNDPGGGGNNNNNSFGGPLMTSIVNGTSSRNGSSSASLTNSMTSSGNPSMLTPFVLDEFNFDLQTVWGDISLADTRTECRQSLTPASTPTSRPPSAPVYSPGGGGATAVQSPMSQYVVTQQQSPAPNPPTPAAYSTYNYSPVGESFPMDEQKDTKVNLFEDNSSPMMVVGGGDSGKLRDLLTKPPNSVESSDSDNKNGRSNKNTHKILKDLLNQKDEDDNENKGSPKVSSLGRTNSIAGPSDSKPNTSTGNHMLRELLSETSDDDDRDVRAGLKPQSELLQQLLKDEQPKSEPQSQEDSLLKSLGFPSPTSGEGRGVKRPHEDRDQKRNTSDGVSSTGTTELCMKNKMLAKLLATQPNPQAIPPIPSSIITATPQDTLNKTGRAVPTNAMKQQTSPHQNPNAMIVAAAVARGPQRMAVRPPTHYLNQILSPENSGMQRSQNGPPFNTVTATVVGPDGVPWEQTSGSDPYLSQLLDQVIDIVQQDSSNDILTLLDAAAPQNNTNGYQQHEVMAINKIQESLMQIEAMNSPTSPNIALTVAPPTYPSGALTTQSANQQQPGFQPPRPGYQRAPVQRPTRPTAPPFSVSGGGLIKQLPMHQKLPMHTSQQQQQQFDREKVRLLTQQQQQHLVIPSNATVEMKPGMQNIDSLLNNTVAPNVSLQRSNSVTDSQLSPTYRGQIAAQQRQRQGAFPQSTVGNYQHNAARVSPHPPYTQQLSPRQVYPPTGTNQNINPTWQQNRLTLQQQQNPMLNAQLTGNFVSGPSTRGGFPVQHSQQQQQQAMGGSPGAAASTRHSPYSADTFPPGSPNASFNQNQYLRLQRTNSAPTATTQLSGGLGSPRPYGREHPPHSSYPPIPQSPHHTMIYQQDSQYCYDQTGLQLPYNGADRGRVPTHLQPGVSASGGTTSEYVRQELRNVVGARQAQPSNSRPQGQILTQNVTSDLDLGGLNYDLPTTGASESPKLWAAMGSDMGSMSPQPATSRTTMEEGPRQGDHNNSRSSLLQKLLSE